MKEYDNSVLISNIKYLMKSNHITQENLAGILGMSQPNVNRALRQTDGKRFTLEQVYDIAGYFGVSIDWLMGNTNSNSISERSIAEFIVKIVSSKKANFKEIEIEEQITKGSSDDVKQEANKYAAIYFPNYWQYEDLDMKFIYDESELPMAYEDGNRTGNSSLNSFLNTYSKLVKMNKYDELSVEDLQTLTDKHLNQLN